MSSMLEQAIIDADALKDAAVKNAETLVLEKYSNQIKNAVENLLEQEDPMMIDSAPEGAGPDMADPFAGPDDPAVVYEESSVMEHIPLAATTRKDDSVEIPLDQLLEEIESMKADLLGESEQLETMELSDDLVEEYSEELEENEELEETAAVALDEEFLKTLAEELTVDIKPQKTGWLRTPSSTIELAEAELLALEQDSKVREERQAMMKAVEKLEKINESVVNQNIGLQESLKGTTGQINKLKKITMLMKEKMDSTNLSNAKLLYQNKALTSDSLNERQKNKLVEAVSSAETIEEAKVIFETLQSTVGSTSRKKQPKSLGEAVQKSSSMILSASRERPGRQKKDPTLQRWKFLAGIDK